MLDQHGPGVRPDTGGGDRDFQEIADFAPVMIWRAGLDKQCDWFNKPWLDFVGRRMDEEVGFGWADGVHPDDYDRCVAIYVESFDARKTFSMEYRLRRHDGEYRWLLDNGAPFLRDGAFAGYFGSCIDITAQKELQAGQLLLINELNHRVKNTLATVQSMAAQSVRGRSGAEAYNLFTARLVALARAHDVLTRRNWDGAHLSDLLDEAVRPHLGRPDALQSAGPDVRVVPKAALVMSMVFHELGGNAGAFGALSKPDGKVAATWSVGSGDDARFTLRWEERGGPTVAAPASPGFGMRLARQLGRELDGDVRLDFAPAGVVFTMDVPLSHVKA